MAKKQTLTTPTTTPTLQSYLLQVKVLTPVVAPNKPEYLPPNLKQILLKKYDEEVVEHIDRMFFRTVCPIHNELEPCLLGGAVRYGILRPLLTPQTIKQTQNTPLFTKEDFVTVYTQRRKEALLIAEVIVPGSTCHTIIRTPPNIAQQLQEIIKHKPILRIGALKNLGFGEIQLLTLQRV